MPTHGHRNISSEIENIKRLQFYTHMHDEENKILHPASKLCDQEKKKNVFVNC